MVNEDIRKRITAFAEENDEEITILDNYAFDLSIIGITEDFRLIYDFEKMIEELAADDEIDLFEAQEYIEYNVLRSLPYMNKAPIIMLNRIDNI